MKFGIRQVRTGKERIGKYRTGWDWRDERDCGDGRDCRDWRDGTGEMGWDRKGQEKKGQERKG